MREMGSISGNDLGIVCKSVREKMRDLLGKCRIMQEKSGQWRN